VQLSMIIQGNDPLSFVLLDVPILVWEWFLVAIESVRLGGTKNSPRSNFLITLFVPVLVLEGFLSVA